MATHARRGRARQPIMIFYWSVLGLSVVLLLLGVGVLIAGQPYHVWYPITLIGVIGTGVMGFNYWTLKRIFSEADQRRLASESLRRA